MAGAPRFDVAIVGASIAGCTAARFFGLAGARVALIEKRPDPDAYKVICTHVIQPSATPTIERLGLSPLLEARGAVRAGAEAWTPYGGWVHFPDDLPLAWGVTRKTLDPILRKLAADTPGVELILGETVTGLRGDGRPAGVRTRSSDGRERSIDAGLVVAADGRDSGIARMAGVRGRVLPHGRFYYFAYWRGIRPRHGDFRLWLLDPDGGAQFPNEDDLHVMVAAGARSRLPEFRADLEGSFMRHLRRFPDGPDLDSGERVSKILGKVDMPNLIRPAAIPGLAFAGDAAMSADPLWGVGCGWAFQSADWLAQETADAVLNGGDLDGALERYRRIFRRRLGLHYLVTSEYARGRETTPVERFSMRAATQEERIARRFGEVTGRVRQPLALLDPLLIPRVIRGNLRAR